MSTVSSDTMRTVDVLFHLVIVGLAFAKEEADVDVAQGTLRGLKTTTILNGKPYYSFKGIPYAKPPIGFHKFEAPNAPDPWNFVLNVTQHRYTCVYYCMMRQKLIGDEDCLYLNVYTPNLDRNSKRAVMVFIHGGGFNGGSGDDDLFGPDFLIEQDVVLVTFNSRLGAHGYLSTGDENAPGNNGLKDQVMVLKWIQENILNFGGSPYRVTLFGVGSGAASVQFHLMSPMSRGLFKGAIIQSGSALNPFAMEYNPREKAFLLAEALGMRTTNTKEIVDKLKELTVQDIATATNQVSNVLNHMNWHMGAFVPVVEPDVGQDMFLTDDPWTLMKNGDIADVPVLIGTNLNETALMAPMFLSEADMMDRNFEFFLPDELNMTVAKKKEFTDMLRKFYLDGKNLTLDSKVPFATMTSDLFFVTGVLMSSKIIAARNKSPVYKYLLSYYSSFGFYKNLFNQEGGVAHGDELGYLFHSIAFNNKPEPGSSAEKMTKVLTKLWTNFAKEGNPTPNLDDDLTETWLPLGADDNYLEISEPMTMKEKLNEESLNVWAHIYKDKLGEYAKLFLTSGSQRTTQIISFIILNMLSVLYF